MRVWAAAAVVCGLAAIGSEYIAAQSGRSVSKGLAGSLTPVAGMAPCTNARVNVQPDVFPIQTGTATTADGKRWTMPAEIQDGAFAVDLYNDCHGAGANPDWEKQLQTVVVDPDGVEITGYIFADNYYELWVNGKFVARDRLAMTPFNSTVVRFRAKYPMTYAFKAIDWETKVGLGMEYQSFNIGDGGMIAYFSDGNGTHADWRAETFYVAPLDDPECVRTTPSGRDSTFCSQAVRPACAQRDPLTCQSLHFDVPAQWNAPGFDARAWPNAITWRPIEVTNAAGYVNYRQMFGDADFIWTRNIRLDNLVLARFTANGPRTAVRPR
jgi:hypothetical protein